MKRVALSLLISAVCQSADLGTVDDGPGVTIRGVSIGASLSEVTAAFGPPKSQATITDAFDLRVVYEGLEFRFQDGRLETIIVEGTGLKLDSGLTIGGPAKTTEGEELSRIGESDCFRVVQWKYSRISRIQLNCAP